LAFLIFHFDQRRQLDHRWKTGNQKSKIQFPTDSVKALAVMKVQLTKLAHARSGDKGDTANVGLIALQDDFYPLLVREVTAARVKEHFKGICKGEVERFELPNLQALNFLLHESLGGGGTLSLMTDAQGKTFSTALLRMEIDVSDDEAAEFGLD
jgi:hypothetical protein